MIELSLKLEDMYEQFYPKLKNKIFHYTSGENLSSILDNGLIFPEKKGVKETSVHSKESMGRFLNAVCLFDLRDRPVAEIEKIRGWYNFLAPRFEAQALVYLVLSEDYYGDITLLSELSDKDKEKAMYLPHIESWHKGPIALQKLVEIYRVNILE